MAFEYASTTVGSRFISRMPGDEVIMPTKKHVFRRCDFGCGRKALFEVEAVTVSKSTRARLLR